MANQIQPNNQDVQLIYSQTADDEIDLRELFSVIWKGKWIVISITSAFAIASIILALYLPNVYKSEALLAPAQSEQQSSGLASLAGQFGGLASMAGINLSDGKTVKAQFAIEVMKSRKFITSFIQKHGILPDLMAIEKWDIEKNTISYDPAIYIKKTNKWVRDVTPPLHSKPSMQEAYKKFMKVFNVTLDEDTGMVKVSIESLSPYIAKQWVSWLVEDINIVMKQRDVSEAIRGQTFIEEQLKKTNVADMRTILYKLMERTAQTIMFANVHEEYVFKTIDPAIAPEERSKPNRALIVILITLIGFILSLSYLLSKYFLVRKV